MNFTYITEDTVDQVLTMQDTLEAVRAVMADQAAGLAANVPRVRTHLGKSSLHMLAASWEAQGVFGQKIYSVGANGATFHVLVYRADGSPWAMIEANRLGQLRTGAASGVASKALARQDSRVLAVIGSGFQMRTQVEAVCAELPIEQVRVWSPTAANREEFARQMSAHLGAEIVAVSSVDEAVDGADVINVLTRSREPVLLRHHVAKGMHVNAAGSNRPRQQEIAPGVVQAADLIVTDDVAQAQLESGDLLPVVEAGQLDWADVRRLADVIAHPPRRAAADLTMFKSHGIGLWDIAAARLVAERAATL